MQFRVHGDELAFRAVVETHATMVWGVCWQVLRRREDVEDAFQATFLILARKCSAIRAADSAAGWLYRVAFRTALAARAQRRRQATELLAVDPPGSLEDQLASIERSEQCDALLEELHALGHRYRQPLVLCYLEGRSRQQAADELGVTLASVKGRLARGLRMLRTRLAMRGMALSGAAALMSTEMNLAGASVSGAPVAQAISQAATACTSAVWLTPAASSGAGAAADASIRAGAVLLAKKGILTMKFAAAIKPTLGALAIGFTYGALALAGGQSADGGPGASTEGEGAVSRAAAPAVVELTSGEIATPDGGAPSGAAVLVAPAAGDYAEWMATAPAPGGVPRAATTTVAPGAASPALPHLAPAADVFVAAPQPIVAPQVIPLPGATPSSGAAVALEAEHWKLKASGLQKKAESLRLKARALREQRGADVEIRALEVDSEVDLTLAEVKLCEARAEQLREGLEQRPSAAWGSPAATASPPAATSPIQAPTPAGMPDWNSH
ncbi:MAG TPA: sigma-70 family RNA polymerase sigma factor, partial [Lacipirellulaceae bacterium]|nr:sigma-70 family RNA polymerase sigma factor [Lacipirellulaceae bacterium]